jgi:hypothetical protein
MTRLVAARENSQLSRQYGCLLLALNRHEDDAKRCLLFGLKRT